MQIKHIEQDVIKNAISMVYKTQKLFLKYVKLLKNISEFDYNAEITIK